MTTEEAIADFCTLFEPHDRFYRLYSWCWHYYHEKEPSESPESLRLRARKWAYAIYKDIHGNRDYWPKLESLATEPPPPDDCTVEICEHRMGKFFAQPLQEELDENWFPVKEYIPGADFHPETGLIL